MIDWLDFVIEVLHDPIPAGRIMSIKHSGETEFDVPKRMPVEGSYSSQILVRSQGGDGTGQATELYISGNPSKFLQGHNVFGSDNLCRLAAGVVAKVCDSLGIPAELPIVKAKTGRFEVKRIDITHSFAFASRSEVQAVLGALAIKSRTRMGRATATGSTVYHGKNSRRHSVKFYCKGDELEAGKKHRLPEELKDSGIKEFADNLLRCEVTLRRKELADIEATEGRHFTDQVINELYWSYFRRVEMAPQADIPSKEIEHMPRAIRSTYLLWKEGVDVQPMMSKATFYRHRHDLLGYGVDIAIQKEGGETNVIPLFRTITGTPVSVPEWAYSKGLIYTGM
jgi:II/X family phage/plasmid replication protein